MNNSKIIAIDAGNCTDVYQLVDFARQYGLEIKKVLQSIIVSRVFTIYQLAHLIVFELPKIIEQFSSTRSKIIVIYGLLHLFVSDPHTNKADTKNLIKEIASSLRKMSKDRFIIVSFAHCNMEYKKLLLPVFDKCIEITNNMSNNILQIEINNHNNHAMNRRKGFRYSKPTWLSKKELLLAPSR